MPDITPQQCEEMLAYLRVQRTVLTPVPIEDVKRPFDRWFETAEGILFECDMGDEVVEERLLTLEALEDEIEAVLALES